MYYPANKIKTNLLASKGELIFKDSKEPYEGLYWVTFKGEIFSGGGPNQTPNFELDKAPKNEISSDTKRTSIVCEDLTYILLKNIKTEEFRINPPSSITFPGLDDYKNWEFKRFFLRKIVENSYYEVKEDIFNSIKLKEKKYLFEIFEPISIDWVIYGPKNKAYEINYQTVKKYNGLDSIHSNYNRYYLYPNAEDLYTDGNEFINLDKTAYKGHYNLDEKEGFISGAKQSFKPKIFPISYEIEDYIISRIINS